MSYKFFDQTICRLVESTNIYQSLNLKNKWISLRIYYPLQTNYGIPFNNSYTSLNHTWALLKQEEKKKIKNYIRKLDVYLIWWKNRYIKLEILQVKRNNSFWVILLGLVLFFLLLVVLMIIWKKKINGNLFKNFFWQLSVLRDNF